LHPLESAAFARRTPSTDFEIGAALLISCGSMLHRRE